MFRKVRLLLRPYLSMLYYEYYSALQSGGSIQGLGKVRARLIESFWSLVGGRGCFEYNGRQFGGSRYREDGLRAPCLGWGLWGVHEGSLLSDSCSGFAGTEKFFFLRGLHERLGSVLDVTRLKGFSGQVFTRFLRLAGVLPCVGGLPHYLEDGKRENYSPKP